MRDGGLNWAKPHAGKEIKDELAQNQNTVIIRLPVECIYIFRTITVFNKKGRWEK